jgi:hypothetical protein
LGDEKNKMVSVVTEYALLAFFAFISIIILQLVYFGIVNSQEMVQNQVNEQEYKSQCNCFQVAGLSDREIIIRNIMCDYVDYLIILWPDYEAIYNETILKNDIVIISHNSSFKDQYSLHYNDCE